MKNLRKASVVTTILSASAATLGLSFYIVGGYGNNINSLSEIQNSGYFGLNTAFEKERTIEYNTKEKYVDYLKVILEEEAKKPYDHLEALILEEENNIREQEEILAPLKKAVDDAKEAFKKDRTVANKNAIAVAEQVLMNSEANAIIADSKAKISNNRATIAKIKLSEGDISRLENYNTWETLFIFGTTLLAIGTVLTIASTSYSIYLKKQSKETTE
ncbi:MAG: hypothetical protein ACRCWU_02030 [Metamycoplasmataceae bacterium]